MDITIDITAQCDECQSELEIALIKQENNATSRYAPYWKVIVKPCEKCMDAAAEDAS